MSYTNQTQHYGLPQYVATDVPAYLTDYNGAMAKIDQGMNAAKTQADSAATAAGQAANDIAALQSTVGTQAAQISAAAQAAAAAQTTANGADEKADTNTESISGLDDRVTALEQGTSGYTEHAYTYSGGISTSLGSLFRGDVINYSEALPIGKTIEDIVAITIGETNSPNWIFLAHAAAGIRLLSTTSTANLTAQIKFLLK